MNNTPSNKEIRKLEVRLKKPNPKRTNFVKGKLESAFEKEGLGNEVIIAASQDNRVITISPVQGQTIPYCSYEYALNAQNHIPHQFTVEAIHIQNSDNGKTTPIEFPNHQAPVGKIYPLEEKIKQYDIEVARLRDENARLKQGIPADSRGDLYVKELFSLGRVEQFKRLSDDYQTAFENSGLDPSGNINAQILDGLKRESVLFEETPAYTSKKEELKQAKEALEQAVRGNRFVNAQEAQKVVDEVKRLKEEYDAQKIDTDLLRASLDGTSVSYLMTTEKDETNYKINLVMPIKHREKANDFSELEQDLISHVHDQWSKLIPRTNGSFTRTNRQGLVQYTFEIPKTKNPSEVKELERTLAESIFHTQRDYSFNALGLRIDLEFLSTTADLDINPNFSGSKKPEPIVQMQPEALVSVQEHPAIQKYPPIPGYDPMQRLTQAGYDIGKIKYVPGNMYSELRAAILVTLAESEKPLFIPEIRERLKELIPQYQTQINSYNLRNTLINLTKGKKLIRVAEVLSKRKRSYELSEKIKKVAGAA